MSTTTNGSEVQFRTMRQYKDHYAPTPEEPQPDYTGKSEDYIKGSELARKAFETFKRRMEEEKKLPPWQKPKDS